MRIETGFGSGTVAYLFRIDPFGNIHNLSAHESRRNNNRQEEGGRGKNKKKRNNFNYDNDVVAAKELHKFSRPTLAELEVAAEACRRLGDGRWKRELGEDQQRGPFGFICDRGAVISCRQIVALYLLRAAATDAALPPSR